MQACVLACVQASVRASVRPFYDGEAHPRRTGGKLYTTAGKVTTITRYHLSARKAISLSCVSVMQYIQVSVTSSFICTQLQLCVHCPEAEPLHDVHRWRVC